MNKNTTHSTRFKDTGMEKEGVASEFHTTLFKEVKI